MEEYYRKKSIHSSNYSDKKFWVINSKTLEKDSEVKVKAISRRVRYRGGSIGMVPQEELCFSHLASALAKESLGRQFFLVKIVLRSLLTPI